MGRLRRSRTTKGNRDVSRKARTRVRTKDLDQIHEDLKPANAAKLTAQPEDEDLPGLGQFYCIQCSRYFVSVDVLARHVASKVHKRRLARLEEAPYTIEEAEAAGGLTRDKRRTDSALAADMAVSPA